MRTYESLKAGDRVSFYWNDSLVRGFGEIVSVEEKSIRIKTDREIEIEKRNLIGVRCEDGNYYELAIK